MNSGYLVDVLVVIFVILALLCVEDVSRHFARTFEPHLYNSGQNVPRVATL